VGCLRVIKIIITFFAVVLFTAVALITWQALPSGGSNGFTVAFSWALRLGTLSGVLLSAYGFIQVLRGKERTIVDVAKEMREEWKRR
jgi:hypothetical protein